jgi:zinc transporter ZupT
MWVSLLFGLVIGVMHYLSDWLRVKLERQRVQLLSFGAGISVAYLFLYLLPELHSGTEFLGKFSFVSMMAGFIAFHLIEKYIYQHATREQLLKDIKEVHSAAFFMYHFIIGAVLVTLTRENTLQGALLFFPVLFHSAVSKVSMAEIHPHIREKGALKFVLASSTLLGVIVAYMLEVSQPVYYSLFGFVWGAMLYVIIRDTLPKEKRGNPMFFLIGVLVYGAILVAAGVP